MGLDASFLAAHSLFQFSETDMVNSGVLIFAVATNNLAMLHELLRMWPRLTLQHVVESNDYYRFVKRMIELSNLAMLRQLRDWWGAAAMKSALEYTFEDQYFRTVVTWEYVRHLQELLVFARETGVQLSSILVSNKNLVADVIGKCGRDAVSVLQMLREWGMGLADVQLCDSRKLWRELIDSADSIRELASWGLTAAHVAPDAFYADALVEPAAGLRNDVCIALVQDLGMLQLPTSLHPPPATKAETLIAASVAGNNPRPVISKSDRFIMLWHALQDGTGRSLKTLRRHARFNRLDVLDQSHWQYVELIRSLALNGTAEVLREIVLRWRLFFRVSNPYWLAMEFMREVIAWSAGARRACVQRLMDELLGTSWELDVVWAR
jgi:hypothetical protein